MFVAFVVLLVAVLWSAIASAAVRISTINYGVVTRFGRRTGRVLNEGLNWILPFGIEKVEKVGFQLREVPFVLETPTKDQVRVKVKVQLQYRPANLDARQVPGDPTSLPLILRFLETTDDNITAGLLGAAKNELGAIAGATDSTEFIQDRELLGFLIDSILRLATPPYLDEANFPGTPVLKPEARLQFYRDNRKKIADALKGQTGSNSPIELRYGIDIETLTLSEVSFSDKVIESMERKREEEANRKAAQIQMEQKIESMKKLQAEGLTAEQAHDTSDVVMGAAEKRKIIDVHGLKGVFNIGGK